MLKIGLMAEFNPDSETHAATLVALQHSAALLGEQITSKWIASHEITADTYRHYDGFWFNTGKPCKNLAKVLELVTLTRQMGLPTFGTCAGFQHLMLELGQNVLRLKEAAHEEYNPQSSTLLITRLGCSLAGREMRISLERNTQVRMLYGCDVVTERYYCNFGVNPDHVDAIKRSPIRIAGSDSEGIIRVIELQEHPFFIGTLYVPQVGSTLEQPHPLVTGFLRAVAAAKK